MAIQPGQNLNYLKTLIKRYEDSVKTIKKAETHGEVLEQERLIQPVLKEMQMVTPRVWDDFVRITRERRVEISNGE